MPDRGERGVVVATLKPLKRLEHAVDAVARVRRAGGRSSGFGLDVYGKDAGSRSALERAIAAAGADGLVLLHGYSPDAAAHFAAASFSLMTSTTEGQSLVLLESMAAGCIPISYDIRYGPDELVLDGETGFLVPDGDVAALADTIRRFLSLPTTRVRQMRAAARERVADFSDAMVYRRWVEVRDAAVAARGHRVVITSLTVPRLDLTADGDGFGLDADVRLTWDRRASAVPGSDLSASWLLLGRKGGRPWREPLAVEARTGVDGASLRLAGTLDPAAVDVGERIADVHVEVRAGSSVRRVRLDGDVAGEVTGGLLYTTSHGNVSLKRA